MGMPMNRRTFIRACAGSVACSAMSGVLPERLARANDLVSYRKSRLVDADGTPIKTSKLTGEEAYVFHYPMRSTPCFLIKLSGEANAAKLKTQYGQAYAWQGGAGPQKDIVAYSAICAHQLSYPHKSASVIRYVAGESPLAGRKGVIICCAHQSIYDPSQGAGVLSGPAPQPLATIQLEYDAATDGLYATGVMGGALFDDFFKAYKGDLNVAYGRGQYRQPADPDVTTIPLSKFTGQVIVC